MDAEVAFAMHACVAFETMKSDGIFRRTHSWGRILKCSKIYRAHLIGLALT